MKLDFMSSLHKYSNRTKGWKDLLFRNINTRAADITSSINTANNNMTESVANFAEGVADIRNKMTGLSNMYLTVSALSGDSSYLIGSSSMPIKEINNILINNGSIRLITDNVINSPIVNVISNSNGSSGNSSDYSNTRNSDVNTVISDVPFEVERIDGAAALNLSIELRETSLINCISYSSVDFGINHPEVSTVEISTDGRSYQRVSFSIEQNGDDFDVLIQDSSAMFVRIGFIQNNPYIAKNGSTRYGIGLHSLSVGLATSVKEGYVIFGPISIPQEIMKASINSNINNDGYSFNNTSFELSYDGVSWIPVSIPFSNSDKPKHLDFNNISENSINTRDPVKTLFVKVSMNGSAANKKNLSDAIDRHTQTMMNVNPYINTTFDLGDKYIVGKNLSYPYGVRSSISSYYDNNETLDTSVLIKNHEGYITKSLKNKGLISNATISSFLYRCSIHKGEMNLLLTSEQFDTGTIKAYKVSNPIIRPMRISESSNVVLPFKEPAGIYTLTDGSISRHIDLRSGFFSSCYQWIYEPHDKPVALVNQLGVKLHEFKGNEIINLLDYFTYDEPLSNKDTPHKVKFNKNYPAEPLGNDFFTILDNKLYSTSLNAIVDSYMFVKEEIQTIVKSNVNSISIYTNEAQFAKTREKLSSFDGMKSAKLNKCGLLKGSVSFINKWSSLISFIKEVEFINGIDEFNTGSRVEVSIPKSSNRFSLGRLIDHFSDIDFVGFTDVFKSKVFTSDELLFSGDYMLEDIGNETFVVLPNGIKTHDLIDTRIIFDSNISNAANGYYSIDYENGVIYSQSFISGETEVEYTYSNVYLSGQMIEVLPKKDYTVNGRQIQVKNIQDKTTYCVLSHRSDSSDISILKSPLIKNLTLSMVTT